MRAVVQRVTSASVTVDNEVVSSIGRGLLVLVGIGSDDGPSDVESIAKKILSLRMWPDIAKNTQWKANVKDITGEVLCVSQFTLMARTDKGKPDFHRAMAPESSKAMYATVLERLGAMYDASRVKDGKFGAMMSVGLENDGPVTFTLDSRKFEYSPPGPGAGTSSKQAD
ncbi:uncharacterized protein EI90DRAFT_2905534 [Cantharellus anzutake]|uniref:uncharacterized protein n=1 Tax=Cantharellus anzutake TaxID=1750568 RepID=UPI00190528BF|nr:uncharacterized protein EI90DRAFT_2905534 [Cantharellus anzutake]KAF8341400.1 hypothetical protein EI90DRAFT_2905534 [Cantharellus anzutake]